MTLDQQIEHLLQEEYNAGRTQKEISARTGITQPHIQRILSDQNKVLGITVQTIMKLFPRATLNLSGDTVNANNSGVNNRGTFNANCESAIIDKILKSDLSAEDKVKFIELVRK